MAKTATKNEPIRFKLLNETKGAVRYQEVDKDGKEVDEFRIGSLYLRKLQFGKIAEQYPDFLTVTVVAEQ